MRFVRHAATAAVLFAAACSSDSSSAPKAPRPLDLTPILGEMSLGGVAGSALVAVAPTTAAAPMTPALTPAACVYSPTAKNFVCPTVTVNGLTITYTFTLYDAAGHPQSAADANTTASVRVQTRVKGSVTLPAGGTLGSATVDRTEDMTLSGLLTGKHTLNGTATTTTTGTINVRGATQQFTTAQTDKTTDVVLPTLGSTARWPLSGNIASDVTVVLGAGTPTALTAVVHDVITFDGTSTVTVAITSAGLTMSCKIDLTGQKAPVCTP
jgi:hypothetical protein